MNNRNIFHIVLEADEQLVESAGLAVLHRRI